MLHWSSVLWSLKSQPLWMIQFSVKTFCFNLLVILYFFLHYKQHFQCPSHIIYILVCCCKYSFPLHQNAYINACILMLKNIPFWCYAVLIMLTCQRAFKNALNCSNVLVLHINKACDCRICLVFWKNWNLIKCFKSKV